MNLAFPVMLALVHQCAPGIAPEAILSVVSVESSFDPLAINVNHVGRFRADTPDAAATIARRWINAGYSVDLGLAQINSKNLEWTGLSVRAAFDPCANLKAAEKVLQLGYARASLETEGLDAISRTFSLYNSGSTTVGFRNNYVSRVWRAAEQVVPLIAGAAMSDQTPPMTQASITAPAPTPVSPSFVQLPGDGAVLIFK